MLNPPPAHRLGIVIPTVFGDPLVGPLVAGIATRHPWQIYVIDNSVQRRSVAASWNEGIRAAIAGGADLILVLNDDIRLHPLTIDTLITVMDADGYNFLSAVDVKPQGITPEGLAAYQPPWPGEHVAEYSFACFLLPAATFTAIGPFDENFEKGYYEDWDYIYRLRRTTLKTGATTAAPFYHYGSLTGTSLITLDELLRNRAYFNEKWGDTPDAR